MAGAGPGRDINKGFWDGSRRRHGIWVAFAHAMKLFLSFIILLHSLRNASAYTYKTFVVYDKNTLLMTSCHKALISSAAFCASKGPNQLKCYCSDQNAMASMLGCVQILDKNTDSFFKDFVHFCASQNVTLARSQLKESLQYLSDHGMNFTDVPQAFNSSNLDASKRSNSSTLGDGLNSPLANPAPDAAGPKSSASRRIKRCPSGFLASSMDQKDAILVDFPIYVNETSARLYYDAFEGFFGNINWSYWSSNFLYIYWALVFSIAAICNWSVVIFPNLRTMFNGKLSRAWRKYITLPALVRRKKTNQQAFGGIFNFFIPSRLEYIIISGFFWLTFLFNALFMKWEEGNPLFKTRYDAMLKLVADRTGIIGTMMLPLLILIPGRNNFLQWVTRWKYSTFVFYHRWIGRIIVILVVLHSALYITIQGNAGKMAGLFAIDCVIYGTVGTLAGCVICIQGLLVLRRRYYEVFLAIHILMAVAFIYGTWKHIRRRMCLEWVGMAAAIWIFDRFVRLCRMVMFGAPKATVTLLADDCLRVLVPRPRHWPSVPGGHAWMYLCHSWYFWQSHPFTFMESTSDENTIVFTVKARKGATVYLAKMLADKPGKTGKIRICVEGPYGETCSVKTHDNAVFVAGGIGIPGMFAESYDLARKSFASAKQRVKLIWIARELSNIEWVWEELLALRSTKVEATIYITKPEEGVDQLLLKYMASQDGSSVYEKESMTKENVNSMELLNECFPHIRFELGRPSMEEIVDKEVEETIKSAAFITCGPPVMVDDLRYAVVHKIDKTEKRIDFFEQLQVWA